MNYQIFELLNSNVFILVGQAIACCLTLLFEKFLVVPKTHMKLRGLKIASIHLCIISFLYYVFLLITGKVIFSVLLLLSLIIILIVVNNAKYKNLQEPLVFSDYDYFTDAFRFPRLYIPFLGIYGVLGIVIGTSLVIFGYFKDLSFVNRFELDNGLGLSICWLIFCVLFLKQNSDLSKDVKFSIKEDLDNLGFVVYLWCYFIEYLKRPNPISNFESLSLNKSKNKVLPHLIAIQSESFFDPRDWNNNIKEDVLANFDVICNQSRQKGKLSVPAFGANTIRTEFSFLTGVSPSVMKGHQFSPYQIMSRKSFTLKSFVNFLKAQGYHTVCIHPYYKKFYYRDIIFKKWEFDEFIDIEGFNKTTDRQGAYIADEAVTKKIISILKEKTNRPIFVFAITMENHGPMHLEKITESEFKMFYKQDSEMKLMDYDLSVYLNHLHNADKMIKELTQEFNNSESPISMVFYGDHIPIMPNAYKGMGVPSGKVPYFIWDNQAFIKDMQDNENLKIDLRIEDLSVTWLSRVTKLKLSQTSGL